MKQKKEKYDFSTKESQYLLKEFAAHQYRMLEYLEEKDKIIEEQAEEMSALYNEINILSHDNIKLNAQVEQLDRNLREFAKVSLLEKILRKTYRIFRKIIQKIYNLIKRMFRKRD